MATLSSNGCYDPQICKTLRNDVNMDACEVHEDYGALVVCCSEKEPSEIILQITGTERLPEPKTVAEKVKSYDWHIETKYYSADINLFSAEEKDLVSAAFADSVHAVIIHFNNKEVQSFEDVKCWMPFVKNFNPHIQILACDNCSGENENLGISRGNIIEWCLKNQFELVELYPDEESDEEDDFRETKGYKRIIQALHAHPWPNLVMKEKPMYQPSQHLIDLLKSQEHRTVNENMGQLSSDFNTLVLDASSNSESADCNEIGSLTFSVQSEQAKKQARTEKIDSLLEEDRWLFNAIGNDDPDGQSFESLFEKFRDMKDKASTLTGDDRRLYAEKVAVAFWRALGGDEDEVAGLSSDEN